MLRATLAVVEPLASTDQHGEPCRRCTEYKYPGLNTIEALGTDFTSVLQKYFRARNFHRYWRTTNGMPQHTAAIRSARLWFDAAVTLVKRQNSVFRMDDEIQKIMNEYEDLARRDASFRKRYRRYASNGYVTGTIEQVIAAPYAFVGDILKLIEDGRLDEAQQLNTKALSVLSNSPKDVQKIILKQQKINVELLTGNARYISVRQGQGVTVSPRRVDG